MSRLPAFLPCSAFTAALLIESLAGVAPGFQNGNSGFTGGLHNQYVKI
jgi:hypothetical protein